MASTLHFLVFAAVIVTAWSLSCPCWSTPHSLRNCAKLTKKDCPYGVTDDICGCCEECADGPGARCGGPWGSAGTCGKGLFCDVPGTRSISQFHVALMPSGKCKTKHNKPIKFQKWNH